MKVAEGKKSNVGPYKTQWFFVRDPAPCYREFRTGGEPSSKLTFKSTSLMKILSNTVLIAATHPSVDASDDLAAMAAYLITITHHPGRHS